MPAGKAVAPRRVAGSGGKLLVAALVAATVAAVCTVHVAPVVVGSPALRQPARRAEGEARGAAPGVPGSERHLSSYCWRLRNLECWARNSANTYIVTPHLKHRLAVSGVKAGPALLCAPLLRSSVTPAGKHSS